MPESIEYYTYLVEKLEAEHKAIKDTPKSEREHSYSLTYATKNLKESKEKLAIAERLRSNS